MAVNERDAARTRARILEVAQDLFAERGYAGTSIADIARELGTSKAALYYHFTSKDQILGALITEPVSTYAELAERTQKEKVGPEELLGALIDLTASALTVSAMLSNDPSTTSALRGQHDVKGYTEALVRALAGPDPSEAGWVRAQAAFAVAKQGTFWVAQASGDEPLSSTARKELLAAALRCLED